MSLDPQVIFAMDFERQVEEAIRINNDERGKFEGQKSDWLYNAAILRAIGKPMLPKPVPPPTRMVTPNYENLTMALSYGDPVADPNFDLPAPPPVNPPGTVQIGPPLAENPGLFERGRGDTMPWGAVVTKDGRKYRRSGGFAGWGWYTLLGEE